MPPLSRRRVLLGVAGTIATAVLTSCMVPPPRPSTAPSAPTTPTPSGPEPIDDTSAAIDLTRRFGSSDLGIDSSMAAIVGGHLLARDDSSTIGSTGGLDVVNALTGARLWTIANVEARLETEDSRLHPRPPLRIATSEAAGVVAVVTYIDPCSDLTPCDPNTTDLDEGYGIAALDIADGSVRWHQRLTPGGMPLLASVVGGDDEHFYANVGDIDYVQPAESAPDDEAAAATIALAVGDGSQIWERRGIVATHVGTVVLGLKLVGGAERVVALDRATGETLWEADADQSVAACGRTMASLTTTTDATSIVDLASGATMHASADRTVVFGDDGAQGEVGAWIVHDFTIDPPTHTMWTVSGGEARPASTPLHAEQSPVGGVADGYVWLQTAFAETAAFDRSGAQRSSAVDGSRMLTTSERTIVLGAARGFEVYSTA